LKGSKQKKKFAIFKEKLEFSKPKGLITWRKRKLKEDSKLFLTNLDFFRDISQWLKTFFVVKNMSFSQRNNS